MEITMKIHNLYKSIVLTGIMALPVAAAELEITITNLTHGNHFTPILAAAHSSEMHLFQAGETATTALQKMAEGGNINDLAGAVKVAEGVTVENPAQGLLSPNSKTATFDLNSGENTHLSLVAMMLPTNDAFIGLDAWEIPTVPGTYTLNLNAYDAGTEANDEVINGGGAAGVPGIPFAPAGNGGTGATGFSDTASNERVHIHPGVVGDTDPTGGLSDVDSRIHRWLNPVARVVVTVK